MQIQFKGHSQTSSGKGIRMKYGSYFYFISFETLNNHGISKANSLKEFVLVLDEEKPIPSKSGWKFINDGNIIKVITGQKDLEEFEAVVTKEKERKNSEFEKTMFFDDVAEETKDEPKREDVIDWDSLYDGIDFYEIKEIKKKKMGSNEKLIQKSIKLSPRKYNLNKITTADINFQLLANLTPDNIEAFVRGEISSIKIKQLKAPKLSTDMKGDVDAIHKLFIKKGFGPFITKTDEMQFLKGKLSLADYVEKAVKRSDAAFIKISDTVREAKLIERETGVNPLVLAWPFISGKTKKGEVIHVPLAYRNVDIHESLDEYEVRIENDFIVNTYPILKNYVDTNSEVNEIIPRHAGLKSLLTEFYKHGIKIARPVSGELVDFKPVTDSDMSNVNANSFTLSNETILLVKPSDEFVFYDLQNIIDKQGDFVLPERTYSFEKPSPKAISLSFITDVDKSKGIAINEAINQSVVIFGPPGTGKSETITNIVGKVIESGKNSLFVAEKATAIEVIEANLAKIGLSDFVVNLNNTSKIDFAEKFKRLSKIIFSSNTNQVVEMPAVNFADLWFKSNKSVYEAFEKTSKSIDNDVELLFDLIEFKKKFNKDLMVIKDVIDNPQESLEMAIKQTSKNIADLTKKIDAAKAKQEKFKEECISKVNSDPVVTKFVTTMDEIEKISKANDVKSVAAIISNKNALSLMVFVKKYADELSQFREKTIKMIKKNFELLEDISELEERLKVEVEKNEQLENSNKNYPKDLIEYVLSRLDKFTTISKESLCVVSENYNDIIAISKIDWAKHLEEREAHIKKVREIVVANYGARMRQFLSVEGNQNHYFAVKRFIENKLDKRSQSIFKLFKDEKALSILMRIFPTIMMNPDHVSTLFPPKEKLFDYVIFDEASQIRLHRAIGALHRANIAIVAGDDKQLGPTDLFTNLDRDEDYNLDMEEDTSLTNDTLLNYAKDNFYGVRLNTHYRSKSKDLIEFSNKTFYSNTISVADSPKPSIDGKTPIVVEELGGIWDNYTNEVEAQRAAELVLEYFRMGYTVGVITFNDQQKRRISELLAQDQELRTFISADSDKFFIKSIKDVQGDEKDIIIFSIAYGRRAQSDTYVKSFGQFSKEKINVAITRSKYRIHVLKSLPSFEVLDTDEDKLVFKRWLEFIESYSERNHNGFNPLQHVNSFRSLFEKDYFNAFVENIDSRYVPLANFPVSGKEIDIAIFDTDTNSFVGAIELDGAKFHSDYEKILEDYERQLFLENLGWKFARTTYHDFYRNRAERVKEDFNNLLFLSKQK